MSLVLALVLSARAQDCPLRSGQVDALVVFLTDDQRFDALEGMATVSTLARDGVVFDRAYVSTPLCSPARAGLLSGGFFAHHTGVVANEAPDGGAARFDDRDTLAVRLQAAGFATGFVGKYLNGYMDELAPAIPPGWTEFRGLGATESWTDFTMVEGAGGEDGESVRYTDYITDVQGEAAARFVQDHGDEPLFLLVAFSAPHYPHRPADEDQGAYDGYTYTGRAWDEADVSDKPDFVQELPRVTDLSAEEQEGRQLANRERLESLLAVDRAVARVLVALDGAGRLDRSLVLFASDNGQMWGEHRLSFKGLAYEESTRVPFVAWTEGLDAATVSSLVAVDLDIGPTLMELAGQEREVDGASLLPLLCGEQPTGWRDRLLLQGWPYEEPDWAGVVTGSEKVVLYATGEEEAYDLVADPYEEESGAPDEALRAWVEASRGLAVVTTALPVATVGAAYETALDTWGAQDPVTWSLYGGALPAGLALDEDGFISGVPEKEGSFSFSLQARDASVSPYDGEPQVRTRTLTLRVGPAGQRCGCEGGAVGPWWAALLALGRRRRTSWPASSASGRPPGAALAPQPQPPSSFSASAVSSSSGAAVSSASPPPGSASHTDGAAASWVPASQAPDAQSRSPSPSPSVSAEGTRPLTSVSASCASARPSASASAPTAPSQSLSMPSQVSSRSGQRAGQRSSQSALP